MKHIMVYVTPDQTAKTVAKFLYQHQISIFGALARLLSDWGANFMSSIIDEMCNLLIVKKLQTHALSPPDEWVGGEVSSNHYADDWEAVKR